MESHTPILTNASPLRTLENNLPRMAPHFFSTTELPTIKKCFGLLENCRATFVTPSDPLTVGQSPDNQWVHIVPANTRVSPKNTVMFMRVSGEEHPIQAFQSPATQLSRGVFPFWDAVLAFRSAVAPSVPLRAPEWDTAMSSLWSPVTRSVLGLEPTFFCESETGALQ